LNFFTPTVSTHRAATERKKAEGKKELAGSDQPSSRSRGTTRAGQIAGDGKHLVVRAAEKLTAFMEMKSVFRLAPNDLRARGRLGIAARLYRG
jgi:hypothetical protein